VFLPCTLLGYYVIHPKFKNTFLLCVSLLFYFFGEPRFTLVMLASIVVNYFSGLALHRTKAVKSKRSERLVLALAVLMNLSILFWFKYLDFAIETGNAIFGTHIALMQITLPIGISFFTFQGMTYVIDLYRGVVPVQKNPLKVALYISLFPQLIAGPIVRYADVAQQIDSRSVDILKFYDGIKRFVAGLCKKTIIANTLALPADKIFGIPPAGLTPLTAWLGIVCYTFQIYFDFSGYSDMAIGMGKMFGFDFLENFNRPYIAKSIREFWCRWHISLSSFFRDYLYFPLGGNRKGNVYFNLLIVFLATGLWHGASWNFVVWGLWHGCFIVLEHAKVFKFKLPNALKHVYALVVVMMGWVLFRADTLGSAVEYTLVMFGLKTSVDVGFSTLYYIDGPLVVVMTLALLWVSGILGKAAAKIECSTSVYRAAEAMGYMCLFLVCALSVMTSNYNPFIYFRF
jgi:alginate O-acetyltransferase complex protein AlgI